MDTKCLLVFLALVATATAGPISVQDSGQCSTTCIDSSKFRYSTGMTYTYDYRVDTETSMAGASEDQAKLTLQTIGDIEVLSPCEFSLQLKSTRLFHTDGSGSMKTADREVQFRSGLEAYPLRFSFQDGKVDHVCPSDGEDAWTLNMKKGFLSAFQNSMDDISQSQNVTETDVAGTCNTEYTVVSNGYYTTSVKKSKNILSCTERNNFETLIQSSPYFIPSDIQSLPLMKTTHECVQSVEVGGVLKSTTCSETHIYRPFASGMSGGRTTVTQKLTYQTYRTGGGSNSGSIGPRDSLVFDHSVTRPTRNQARLSVEQKLGEICDKTVYDIRPESPRLFSELVLAMKSLDADDTEDLYRLLKTKALCPKNGKTYKFYFDALPMTNSPNSVRLMSKLIDDGDVKGLQAKAWLTSLAFIPVPTSDMILNIKSLIDNKKVRKDALLPVSSLINNYCRQKTSCDHDYAVLSIISSFERTIRKDCDATGNKFEDVLLTIKAIGNAGHASRAIVVLDKCMITTTNPMEIRIAAIEAFRRMPCTDKDENLWNLFMETSLDSELRIAAYMAIMRCPTEDTLGKLASFLFSEDNEQVGAFVYSHLTNLRESSNPHKQNVAKIIKELTLDKEFDMSPLKFSRNYEISTLINKLNTGFTAESNMIWSSSDQLPRSIAGNLTVELFGQSVNIFDFGGRLEGLEYLLRNVLGPYVNSEGKVEKKVDFDKIQASVFGRVFGNEMMFIHSKTFKSPLGKMPNKWMDVLIKLSKKQELAMTKSLQFMDACMIIPTSAGLPLQIHVNGTAIVDVYLNGKVDLRKVRASPSSMNVDGEFRPSAALEVTGTMAVDAFVTKTGLRMRNTMHSSTSLKGRIQLNRGQQINIEFDTPEDKLEIFGAKSKFFILHNNIEQEQEMIKDNRKEYEVCSGSNLATIFGMELCGQVSFPNASLKTEGPYFPLTGPSSFSVALFKRDTHSSYKLFGKIIENKRASIAQFSVNTPGSKIDRAITLDMTLNYAKQMVEVSMYSPWKKTELTGNLINQDGMKSLAGRLVIDDFSIYSMTAEVKTLLQKNKIQYSPMIEIKRPGADDIQLIGVLARERPFKSLNIDMTLSGVRKLPYTFKSTLVNTKKEKSVFASFSNDNKNIYSIEAYNQLSIMGKKAIIATMNTKFNVNTPTKKLIAFSGSGDFRQDKTFRMDSTVAIYRLLKKPASLKVNLVKLDKKKGSRYDLDASLKSSMINARIDSDMFFKPSGFLSTKVAIDYSIPKVDKNRIVFGVKINDRSTKAYKKYSLKGHLNVKNNPDYNNGLILGIYHKKRHSEMELDVKYGANPNDKTKKIYLFTQMTKKISNPKNSLLNYEIKAQAPAHDVDVLIIGKHMHTPNMLDSNVQFKYSKDRDINAAIRLRDQSAKLKKYNGRISVNLSGQEYVANTQLFQKSAKHYSHVLNLKKSDGTKYVISTIYKTPTAATHEISTDVNLHGQKPMSLAGSATLNMKNFQASAKFMSGKDTYGISTASKITKTTNAKFNIEIMHPARRMTLDVNGGKIKNKYEGSVEAAWDADKEDSRVLLDGDYLQKSYKGAVSLGGTLNFRSPFMNFENLLASFKYGNNPTEHNAEGKFSWGGKSQQFTSNMNVKRDFSLNNVDITVGIKTPFKGIHNAEISVDHNLDKTLNTVVKGNLEKETVKLVLQGQDQSNSYTTDVKGNFAIRSTLKNAEVITGDFSHRFSDGKLITKTNLNHNGQKYECDVNMAHSGSGWQFKNNGDVAIKTPVKKIATKWAHKNTDQLMEWNVVSTWGKNTIKVDFSGSHELSDLRKLNADLQIKSPWTRLRNIEISLDHKHGNGLIQSNTVMKQNGKTKMSSKINFNAGDAASNFDFELKTPLSEDLNGKLSAEYDKYPMTTSAELAWAPKKKVTLEGSLNLASWENANVNMKITTPSRLYGNVLFKASNKKNDDEIVSHMILDYGVRQIIDLESRLGYSDQKKFVRVKLMSPFHNVKSLDTGLSFDGSLYNFDSRADFELLPTLGKFETLATWQFESDMSGKVRVNTPFQDYPYFEISTSSMLKSDSRQTRVQLEYYPHQIFSFDSSYTFALPLAIEATIRSPYPEYDNLGVIIQHNHGDSFIRSHSEIKYQPDTTIEGDLNADWSSDIDGSLVIKTPFEDMENNQIFFKHNGDKKSFSTHGEVFIAQKKIVADASFKSGYSATCTFTLSSPIPEMENIRVTLKKRGTIDNLKGGIVIIVNKEKTQINFVNKVSLTSFKSSLNILSPYSDDFKISLDHTGPINSFTNKMSVNYGRKVDIDTIASFDLREPDINADAVLKYKIGKARNAAKMVFKKSGPIDDMSFSGSASFNKDGITVSGLWKNVGEIDGSINIKTPFKNFKSTGMTVSHKGNLEYFQSNVNVNYMDDKNIYGKIELSNRDGRRLKFLSQLSTPFKNFKTTTIELNNDINEISNQIDGSIVLTTTLNRFGTGNIVYSKSGDLNNLMIDTSVTKNGKDMATLIVKNDIKDNEIHSKFSLKTVVTPAVLLTIDHSGDILSFNTKTVGAIGKNTVSGEANMKRGYQSLDVDSSILVKLAGRDEKKCSLNVHTDGEWERCNLHISGMLNDDEVKLSASKRGRFDELSFDGTASFNDKSIDVNGSWKNQAGIEGKIDIKTPFDDFKNIGATLSHSGDASKFSSSAAVNYMDNKKITGNVDLTAYALDRIRLSTHLSTPFRFVDIKFNHDYDSYTTDISGNVDLSTSVANLGTKTFSYSKTGTLKNLKLDVVSMDNGIEALSLKISNDRYGNEMHSIMNFKSTSLPVILLSIDHTGDLNNLKSTAKGQFGKNNMITIEAILNIRDDVIDGEGKFKYNIVTLGKNHGSLKIHKEGQNDDINAGLTVTVGNKVSKFVGNFKNTDELIFSMTVNTPLKNFKDIGLSFKHRGNLEQFKCEGMIEVMDDMVFTSKIDFYRYFFRRIETAIEVTTPFNGYEFTKYEYRHEGEQDSFKCSSTLQYKDSKKITYDLTVSTSPVPDFTLSFKTPDNGISASGSLEYTWPKYAVKGNIDNRDGRVLMIDGSLDATSDLIGSLLVNTPIEDFTDIGLSFTYSPNRNGFASNGKITYMDGKTISGKIDIDMTTIGRLQVSAELRTPFLGYEFTKYEMLQIINKSLLKSTTTLIYGNDKTIIYEVSRTLKSKQELIISLKTPFENYEELMAYLSLDYTWPKYSLNSKINAGNNNVYSFSGSFDVSNDISGELSVATPYEGFTDIGMNFLHSGNEEKFGTEGKITYMDGKSISGKVYFDMAATGKLQVSAELRTPFLGYEFTKYEILQIIRKRLFKSTAKLIYGNDKTILYEVSRTLKPKQELVISLKTPFENYEELMAYLSLDNTWPKYSLNSKINAGNNNVYSLSGSFDVSNDISGELSVATPYEGFTDIGMNFLHSGNEEKFGTEGKITYMDGKVISGKVNFYRYMWRRIVASTELNTPFIGMEYTKAEMNFEDNSNSISTTTAFEYGTGNKLNGNVKLTYSPNYDVLVTLNTPFKDYKLIRAQGSLDITAPTYEVTYNIDGGYSKVYSATGKLNFYSLKNIDASLEMNTPVTNYEYTKAEYQHNIEASEIDGSMSLIYMNGQEMSAELKTSLTPNFDATVTVKTPFLGYENMQANAVYEHTYNRYETSSSLNLGRGQIYSTSSVIDYSSFPIKLSAKISTPYTDFRNIELSLTHDGELNNFVSTGLFTSPLTDDVRARASLRFDSLFDLTAATSLQSSLVGFDDMKAEIKISNEADEKKSHFLLGWTSGQEVIVDGTHRSQKSWYENKLNTEVSISTPFTVVRSLVWQLEVTDKDDDLKEKTTFELNGESLLDIDIDHKFKDKPEIQITVRQPWPMLYTARMSRDSETADAEVFINWNGKERDSNIRMQATLTDKSNEYQTEKSLDFRITHASRQVGFVQKINVDSTKTASSGHIYWDSDDNSRLSYDLQLNENSRRRKQIIDGSLKLGLPSRTFGLTSSYSDNQVTKTGEAIFSWDVDRDESKQVGVKATVNSGDGLNGDITIRLPSLRKEIRVDGEVMMKNGRVIFDAKTDFSYSRDSRKTLTLISKLTDVSDYYSNYNYSLSVGVSHPYTNIDMKIDSHIGSSDERTTFGMNANYLTAKRQIKNLALLTEINKLKKQINLQVNSPLDKIEITGDIVSTRPYKVRMLNKRNDVETFRSDITVDQNKKSFVLNTYLDSKRLTVSAKYPNSTAFQADITHYMDFEEHKEALFAARLNTSHLLHTRLHWRPEVMNEMRVVFLENAVKEAVNVKLVLADLNEAIIDEISAKYVAIADEVTRELRPFIAALNEELTAVAAKMSDLSRELRSMYDRNDFYIQNMGEEITAYYMMLQEKLIRLTQEYRTNYQELIQTMTHSLRDLRSFPIRERYTQIVNENVQWMNEQVTQSLTWLETTMDNLDKTIQEYQDKALYVQQYALDTVYNVTYVDYLSNKIGQLHNNINLRPYISSFKLPETYTNAIYDAHSALYTKVNDLLDNPKTKFITEGANEVYQQSIWAYKYWQLEENIRKHTHSILELLKEIVQDELKEWTQELKFFIKNPITVWDPEHGEVQADLSLPMAVKRLDEMPDVSPLVKKTEEMAALYLPDKTTWNKFVKSVSDMIPIEEKSEVLDKRVPKQLRHRKRGRYSRVRVFRQ